VVQAAARAEGQRAQLQRQAADRQREVQREELGLQAAEHLAQGRRRSQTHVGRPSTERRTKREAHLPREGLEHRDACTANESAKSWACDAGKVSRSRNSRAALGTWLSSL